MRRRSVILVFCISNRNSLDSAVIEELKRNKLEVAGRADKKEELFRGVRRIWRGNCARWNQL